MRAVGYFSEYGTRSNGDDAGRASAAEPASTGSSLAAQNDEFLRFCDANGYQPAAAFLDAAGASDRPGLRQLLDYLDQPEKGFISVVISAFARLGPERAEAARTYYQVAARGAQILSVAEGPLDDARLIELWRVDPDADLLGDRVRSAMRRRAIKGQVLGRPPYGYRVGKDRRLEIVEEEAALVRMIFGLYLQDGLGIRLIAKRLNGQGYRTRRGGNWSMITIRDLLRNRAYVGTYTRFGVRVPGNHPAIVAESQFQPVQERMQQRRRPAAKPQRSRFLLSGLVYCGDDGSRMIGVTRRQRWTRRDGEVASNVYRYYQSEARTNQSVGEYHTRRADDLEAEVLRHLAGEVEGAVRSTVLTAGDARAVAAEVAASESRLRSRMRGLDRRLADALTAAAKNRLGPERLHELAEEITADYQQSARELDVIGRRAAACASEDERRHHQERQLHRLRHDWPRLRFEERQALVRDLVEKVVVDDESVRTVLRA